MSIQRAAEDRQKQPYPFTPSQHAQLLHPVAREGLVWLARNDWQWEARQPYELDAVLDGVAGEPDVYMSQGRFAGPRTIARLKELCTLYSDLDYYQVPGLKGRAPEAVLEMALERLEGAGIPEPSLAISSGRGLYVKWLHVPVTRRKIDTWNRCQARLYEVLKPLGADRAAQDAARVLRLVGTTNSKNGALVCALGGAGEVWHFDELAEQVLPAQEDREEQGADLYDIRVQRVARRGWRAPRGFTVASLAEARLTDLQTLRRIRYGDEQMTDERDRWLVLAGVAMSWLIDLDAPEIFQRELLALAEEAGGWDEDRSRSKLQAIFKRVHMAARGEKVMWEGSEWDPRYHFKNETIINWLGITLEEQREMVVLIGEDEARRRRTNRKRRERRRAGVRPRARYDQERTASLQKNFAAARQLKKCGLSTAEIAADMGVSERTVQRWLK